MALISAQIVAKTIGKAQENSNLIFRKGSTTYYYTSLFFPDKIKKDVFDLYAYVRVMDDFVDSPTPNLRNFNKMWLDTLKEWRGEKTGNAVVSNFIRLAKNKNFDWEWVKSFYLSMKNDTTKKNYETYKELEDYMYGSAEVVGLMMARIMNLPKGAENAARLQGRAMQLINFIRDVKEDDVLGRNYLGYSADIKKSPDKWNEYIRKYIDKYREIEKEAEKGYKFIPKRYLVPVKTAAQMYTWTSDKIYSDPMMVWKEKVKPKRAFVVLSVLRNILFE
jgi:phytoene synthase